MKRENCFRQSEAWVIDLWQIDLKDGLFFLSLLLLVLCILSFYLLRIYRREKGKNRVLEAEIKTFKEVLYHLPLEIFVFKGKELYFQNKRALEVFGMTFNLEALKWTTTYRGKRLLPVKFTLRDNLEVLLLQDVTEKEGFKEAYQMALSYLSHELKTPLAIAYLHFEDLEKSLYEKGIDGELSETFQKAKEALERLQGLVKKLFSGLDYLAKDIPVKKERISLKEILEEAIFWVSPLAEDKKIDIELSIPEENYFLQGSEELLTQAFSNVLENAIKVSPEGSKVLVKVYLPSENKVTITIRDFGPGVEPEKLHLLGVPFMRLRKDNGMGLGLFITRRIVEAHGGALTFHLPQGGGLEVKISLPI